jgi:hypothetical protein
MTFPFRFDPYAYQRALTLSAGDFYRYVPADTQ